MSGRSPLARVRFLGSAKEGVSHWWIQRLTSVALLPLGGWLLASLVALPALDYRTVVGWISHLWTAVFLLLFVVTAAWHSRLGVQVVVEDYVHDAGTKAVALAASSFAHALLAAAGVLAVLRIAIMGGPS